MCVHAFPVRVHLVTCSVLLFRLKYTTFVNRMAGYYQQFIKECTMLLQGGYSQGDSVD